MDAITKQYWVLLASVLSRDNISRYFYGVLHESNYREVYAADLKRESSMVCVCVRGFSYMKEINHYQ